MAACRLGLGRAAQLQTFFRQSQRAGGVKGVQPNYKLFLGSRNEPVGPWAYAQLQTFFRQSRRAGGVKGVQPNYNLF
ncbi:MAG: hypothetical protein MUC60_03655 [Oscillatoria sp. Prado101]|nr:hypothetical protein [Oscillatoria sp. Prado101]